MPAVECLLHEEVELARLGAAACERQQVVTLHKELHLPTERLESLGIASIGVSLLT